MLLRDSTGRSVISIHALLAESDGILLIPIIGFSEFLSTLSLRRATPPSAILSNGKAYFYPRSPCGERLYPIISLLIILLFLSTLSLRRATMLLRDSTGRSVISIHALLAESDTWARGSRVTYVEFLSTLSLRRATFSELLTIHPICISIHALLAESDWYKVQGCCCILISIHALLAESDATARAFNTNLRNFYPRSPCGERLQN